MATPPICLLIKAWRHRRSFIFVPAQKLPRDSSIAAHNSQVIMMLSNRTIDQRRQNREEDSIRCLQYRY